MTDRTPIVLFDTDRYDPLIHGEWEPEVVIWREMVREALAGQQALLAQRTKDQERRHQERRR